MCASGGYYVAAAADKIYADKGSLVGSIGVRMDGFGFVDSMHKLGVERRLFTAGENKGFLDPFSSLDPVHVEHVRKLLADVHQQFINTVLKKRRSRLSDDPALFSGLVWTGERALWIRAVNGTFSQQDHSPPLILQPRPAVSVQWQFADTSVPDWVIEYPETLAIFDEFT